MRLSKAALAVFVSTATVSTTSAFHIEKPKTKSSFAIGNRKRTRFGIPQDQNDNIFRSSASALYSIRRSSSESSSSSSSSNSKRKMSTITEDLELRSTTDDINRKIIEAALGLSDASLQSINNLGGQGGTSDNKNNKNKNQKTPITSIGSAAKTRASAKAYLEQYEGQTGASIVYTKLQDNGVTVVNGYSGGAILPVLDQFHPDHPRHRNNSNDSPRIRWITNSNESSAGHIAEGYAKSTNPSTPLSPPTPGVVIATSGPGVTNLITPLQDAICDGVPIVVLCGQAATVAPPDAFQSAPAVQMTTPCTKWSYRVKSAADLPWAMDYAFYVATHGKPGPVFLDLPKDIQTQMVTKDLIEEHVRLIPEGPASAMAAMGDGDDRIIRIVPHVRDEGDEYHAVHLGKATKGLSFEVVETEEEGVKNKLKLKPVTDRASCGYHNDHHPTNMIYWGGLREDDARSTVPMGARPAKNDQQEESGQSLFHSELFDYMIQMLRNAKRPIILAGQGCNEASEDLTKLANTLQIPVTTTLHGLGCFDERHPLALNMLGMHGHATPNFMVQEADLIISIGSRFDDRITGLMGKFVPEARKAAREGRGGIIHVDVRKTEMAKQVEPTLFVHSTGADFLRVVNEALDNAPEVIDLDKVDDTNTGLWLERMKLLQREFPVPIPRYDSDTITEPPSSSHSDSNPSPTTPSTKTITRTKMSVQHVISELNRLLVSTNRIDDAIFSTGVGIHQMAAAQLITWTKPRQMLSSGSLGTMGVALGYSIGAKLANPRAIVIAIDGDGSFNMTFTELKTVAEQKIPVKIIVMDNESQMMVEVWQRLFFEKRYLAVTNVENPEYTKLADAFGIKNLYCDCEEDLEDVLNRFLFEDEDEPVLLHVRITRTPCFPMVAPGKALDDMILADEEVRGKTKGQDSSAAPS